MNRASGFPAHGSPVIYSLNVFFETFSYKDKFCFRINLPLWAVLVSTYLRILPTAPSPCQTHYRQTLSTMNCSDSLCYHHFIPCFFNLFKNVSILLFEIKHRVSQVPYLSIPYLTTVYDPDRVIMNSPIVFNIIQSSYICTRLTSAVYIISGLNPFRENPLRSDISIPLASSSLLPILDARFSTVLAGLAFRLVGL